MTRRGARLTAAITGKGREVGAEKAHELNVLALGRKIAGKERRLRELARERKRLQQELRADRRELRAVLQRKSDVTLEQLELAGKADGADRAIALSEALQPAPPPAEVVIIDEADVEAGRARAREAAAADLADVFPTRDE